MKLNIKKIEKLLEKHYLVVVRESLFNKEVYNKIASETKKMGINLYIYEDPSCFYKKVRVFKINPVSKKVCSSFATNNAFFHNWRYFVSDAYSNHAYSTLFNKDYYLIDCKDLFNDNEELE